MHMNTIFMGTPDFALPCLELLTRKYNVSGVFCQPDKPKGRKMLLTPPPIKEFALSKGLPVYQPATLRDGTALDLLKKLKPDLIIVVAYGKILPREILELPKHGCINIHGSLLPKLRGAAPIQWAILNGDSQTGVTSMMMDEGLDTGDMLISRALDIGENETAGELFLRLSELGAVVLDETLRSLESGTLTPIPQPHTQASSAPMLRRSHSPINWAKPAREIHNQVRGLNPWPCASAQLLGAMVKVLESRVVTDFLCSQGEVFPSRKRLIVGCGGDSALEIITLQPPGKKAMAAGAFLAGRQ
ncbi:MAG: methionyl-tRNA formyltransferase [Oscillospiraceae bacterium]|nr:methionyl-tRNA formyltransferase [Oscillospiraceae bacterium]